MGYDVEITRAPWGIGSEHFPITFVEWAALAERRDDMRLYAYVDVFGGGGHIEDPADMTRCIWLVPGGGRLKSPETEQLRYMISAAADLDAWVVGQDGEVYRVDPDGEVRSGWTPPAQRWFEMHRPDHPRLSAEKWWDTVAAQADFQLLTEIEARCPSGLRSVPCSPTPHWMANPHGPPVPFVRQHDSVYFPVEHRHADWDDPDHWPTAITEHGAATLVRARLIADQLGAEIDD